MSLSDDIEKVIALASSHTEKTAAPVSGVASDGKAGKIPAWVEKISSEIKKADGVTAEDVRRFLGAH